MNNIVKLLISILLPLMVGGVSGAFTVSAIGGWYAHINKPWFNPPNWIFGPVWTFLYILMGIAFFGIWKSGASIELKKQAMILYFAQLLFNFCWSLVFFYLQKPGWAFAEITILWLMILFTILSFGKIASWTSWLLVPYISWVSFAAMLNFSIWRLNVG